MFIKNKISKISKKALALLISAVMLCALLPAAAMAAPPPGPGSGGVGGGDVCTCQPVKGLGNAGWQPRDYCDIGQARLKAELRAIIANGPIVNYFEGFAKSIANNGIISGMINGFVTAFLLDEIISSIAAPEIADIVSDYIYDMVSDMVGDMLDDLDLSLGENEEFARNYIAAFITKTVKDEISAQIVSGALITDIIDASVKNITAALFDPVVDALFDALIDSYVEEIWNNGSPTNTFIIGHWNPLTQKWNDLTIDTMMLGYLAIDFTAGLFTGKITDLMDQIDLEALIVSKLSIDWVLDQIVKSAVQVTKERTNAIPVGTLIDAELQKILNEYTGVDCGEDNHQWRTVTILPTCTEAGSKTSICLICMSVTKIEVLLPTGHKEVITSEAPTCTKAGFINSTCSVCGEVISNHALPALGGHKRMSEPEYIAPTCTAVGYEGYSKCFDCDDYFVYTKQIEALGHTPGEPATIPATCTEDGHWSVWCEVCGEQLEYGVIPAPGHTPGAAADCTHPQICTVCNEVLVPALGHTPGAAADCEHPQICTVCNEVLVPALGHTPGAAADCEHPQICTVCNEVLVPALGHDWGDWKVTTAATCETAGVETRTCANDASHTETRPIAAPGHAWDAGVVTLEPTETAEGVRTFTCTVCSATKTESIPALGEHNHDWGEWIVTTPATCVTDGVETRVCADDASHTETRPIAAPGHTPGAAADCTHPQICTVCNDVLVPALGHTPGAAADCTHPQICTVCNEVLVPALGHTPGTAADCEHPQICTVCNEVLVPALGHTWDEGVVTLAPTATTAGVKTFTCKVCSATKTESIPATGGNTGGGNTGGGNQSGGGGSGEPPAEEVEIEALGVALSSAETRLMWLDYDVKDGIVCYDAGGKTHFVPFCFVIEDKMYFYGSPLFDYYLKPNPKSFNDIESHWAFDDILFTASREVYQGYDDGSFRPNDNMTRAMFVTVLARLAIADLSEYEYRVFDDTDPAAWYGAAVAWAFENGIVTGDGGKFNPNGFITRQEMILMISRFLSAMDIELMDVNSGVSYADSGSVSSWAVDAVAGMSSYGIVQGKPGNLFDPLGNATRAEVATIIRRLIESAITESYNQDDAGLTAG